MFQNFQMASAAIFDICNQEILLANRVHMVEIHERAKFRQNRSIGCENIIIFLFLKMAAVRHLGFLWGIFRPPSVSTYGCLSLCKI